MIHRLIAVSAAVAFIAGCASSPRPTEELTRARTLVEQASQAGAQEFAPADLATAREELQRAETDANAGRQDDARRGAERAAVDAQLAAARASSGKAQRAAQEVTASVETLRREAARDTGAAPAAR